VSNVEPKQTLPAGWSTVQLPDLIPAEGVFVDGDWVESVDQDPDGEVRLVQLADIGENVFLDKSARFLTREKARELKCTFLEARDVLISRMGDPIGRTCIFPVSSKQCVTVVDACIVRVDKSSALPELLSFWANSPDFQERICAFESGSTRKRISRGNLARIDFPLPPLPEQRRIVAELEQQLSRLDKAVEALRRAQRNLRRYRDSVLKAACEGRLVPTEAELARREGREYEPAPVLLQRILAERRRRWEEAELAKIHAKGKEPTDSKWKAKYKEPAPPNTDGLPELPEGWCWASPAQIASSDRYSLGIGPFGSDLKVSDYADDGVPLVFVRDIRARQFGGGQTRFVSPEKARELQAHYVRPGDILVTKMGEPPGDTCLYPTDRPPAIITADCIRLRVCEVFHGASGWVARSLESATVCRQIERITQGVAQKKISLERFSTVAIPLPPLRESKRIWEALLAFESRQTRTSAVLDAQVARADRLRRSLLREAFSGRLVPQDPNDEPASALLARIRAEREATAPGKKSSPSSRRGRKPGKKAASRGD